MKRITTYADNRIRLTSISQDLLRALRNYKCADYYFVNRKLRGVDSEAFTDKERAIINLLPHAPRARLTQDVFVYRGVGANCEFNSLDEFKPGEIYTEKGFTSTSPILDNVKGYMARNGILQKILLPKGTKVIDIDTLLKANLERLKMFDPHTAKSLEKGKENEWILLPNKNFKVLNYSPTKTYSHFTDSDGVKHEIDDGCKGVFNLVLCG